jgi:hypothetical protein
MRKRKVETDEYRFALPCGSVVVHVPADLNLGDDEEAADFLASMARDYVAAARQGLPQDENGIVAGQRFAQKTSSGWIEVEVPDMASWEHDVRFVAAFLHLVAASYRYADEEAFAG